MPVLMVLIAIYTPSGLCYTPSGLCYTPSDLYAIHYRNGPSSTEVGTVHGLRREHLLQLVASTLDREIHSCW